MQPSLQNVRIPRYHNKIQKQTIIIEHIIITLNKTKPIYITLSFRLLHGLEINFMI
jgi:hypothetical protein